MLGLDGHLGGADVLYRLSKEFGKESGGQRVSDERLKFN